MKEAINAYRHITATPEFRQLERMREDARYNEAAARPALTPTVLASKVFTLH